VFVAALAGAAGVKSCEKNVLSRRLTPINADNISAYIRVHLRLSAAQFFSSC